VRGTLRLRLAAQFLLEIDEQGTSRWHGWGGSMLESIKRIWFGSENVEFESSFGLEESIEHLRAATRRWALFSPREVAVGKVTESRVSLQRVIPMVHNSFKPSFVGRFERRGAKICLVGCFAINRFTKVFMAIWICGVAAMTLLATVLGGATYSHSHDPLPMPLFGAGMVVFAVLLSGFASWLSRNDSVWLSRVIREALKSPATMSAHAVDRVALNKESVPSRPFALIGMCFLLAIQGVALCVSAISGIQSYYGSPNGSIVTHYHDIRIRYVTALIGMALLALSFGVHQKRLAAWRLVFVVFAAGAVLQLAALFANDRSMVPFPVVILFCVMSLLILVVWGRWWYAQREHFLE
jgi:hypothetical protein